jgi:hypothetical protein
VPTSSSEPEPDPTCRTGYVEFDITGLASGTGNGPGAIPAPRPVPTQRNPQSWTGDLWFLDQDDRTVYPNEGWWALRRGQATGRIIGGNLGTLNLLQGTGCLPSMERRSWSATTPPATPTPSPGT